MLNQEKRHPRVARQVRQEVAERFQSPGRRTDTYDRERIMPVPLVHRPPGVLRCNDTFFRLNGRVR
jgi:hypothetical protein